MNQQWLPVYISLLTPVTTLAIVMVGFLYNNSRMNDFRDFLRAEMTSLRAEYSNLRESLHAENNNLRDSLRAEMTSLRTENNNLRDSLRAEMTSLGETLRAEMAKNQTEMLMKFAELDNRLSGLERLR